MLSLSQMLVFTLLALLTVGLGVGFGFVFQAKRSIQAQLRALQAKNQGQSERLVELQTALDQRQQEQAEMAQALAAARVESAQKQALVMVNQQLEQRNLQLEQASQQQQQRLQELQEQQHRLAVQLKQRETEQALEQAHHEQRLQWFTEAKQQLVTQFEQLAHQALQQNSDRFSKSQQDHLSHLLTPFKEQLTTFQKKVEYTYDQENRDRHSLLSEIQQLKSLNVQMSEEATNLTRALKGDNKAQGHWGEVVLERVLERSGLRKDQEYEVQKILVDAQGKRQIPDVIVRLPENKDIVIDAKVSLVHYEAYANAETPQEQQAALKLFKKSLRQHLEGLAKRHYEHLPELRSLDFVFLFMPIETAFLVALEQDPQLFAEAYEKNIILVSPSTLLATLRTVQSIWRYERQNRNAEQMADVAGGLFDQCVRVIETLQGLGKQLQRAHETYDKAMGQLSSGRGNLVRRVEQLETLGARVKKSLPSHMQSAHDRADSEAQATETSDHAKQMPLLEKGAEASMPIEPLETEPLKTKPLVTEGSPK